MKMKCIVRDENMCSIMYLPTKAVYLLFELLSSVEEQAPNLTLNKVYKSTKIVIFKLKINF